MFDKIDGLVREWIESAADRVPVWFGPPASRPGAKGVGAYLLSVESAPPLRGARRPPIQATLRYLVNAWGPTPEEAHALLGKLYVSAAEREGLEIDPAPPSEGTWAALGAPPQPSFIVKALFRHERPERKGPLVRQPLVVRHGPAVPLEGRVVGPGRIPVMGAEIQVPELSVTTTTDASGRFRFAALPSAKVRVLRVLARGKEYSVEAKGAGENGTPSLVIELSNLLEE